jgi:hypothetical protein
MGRPKYRNITSDEVTNIIPVKQNAATKQSHRLTERTVSIKKVILIPPLKKSTPFAEAFYLLKLSLL